MDGLVRVPKGPFGPVLGLLPALLLLLLLLGAAAPRPAAALDAASFFAGLDCWANGTCYAVDARAAGLEGSLEEALGLVAAATPLVVELDLSGNALTGPLSAPAALPNLALLNVSFNALAGPVSDELGGRLGGLTVVDAEGNPELVGPWPDSVLALPELAQLEPPYLPVACEAGFVATEDGACRPLLCVCSNGTAATGPSCPADDAELCVACEEGYELQAAECSPIPPTPPPPPPPPPVPSEPECIAAQERALGGETVYAWLSMVYAIDPACEAILARDKDLSGPIPPSIRQLRGLTAIDLSKNSLTGDIPTEIASLTSLRRLSLANNDIEGEVPSELGQLTKLEELDLRRNRLWGGFPEAVLALPDAAVRNVEFVAPPSLPPPPPPPTPVVCEAGFAAAEDGTCRPLACECEFGTAALGPPCRAAGEALCVACEEGYELRAAACSPIPPPLPSVEGCVARQRAADGAEATVYQWLNDVYNDDQECSAIEAPGRGLAGPLPPAIRQLRGLTAVDLSNNAITGRIPSEFGVLTELRRLDLANNDLEGRVPTELGLLSSLEVLDLGGNALLYGGWPREVLALPALTSLPAVAWAPEPPPAEEAEEAEEAEGGEEEGEAPLQPSPDAAEQLGPDPDSLPPQVTCLQLQQGSAPPGTTVEQWLGAVRSIDPFCPQLLAAGKGLTGAIPASIASTLPALTWIDLAENAVEGAVPAELGLLPGLTYLNLTANRFEGRFPHDADWSPAAVIDVRGNAGLAPQATVPRVWVYASDYYISPAFAEAQGLEPVGFLSDAASEATANATAAAAGEGGLGVGAIVGLAVGAAAAAGLLAAAFLAVRRARRPPEAPAEAAGTVVGVAVPLTGASAVTRKTAGKWG